MGDAGGRRGGQSVRTGMGCWERFIWGLSIIDTEHGGSPRVNGSRESSRATCGSTRKQEPEAGVCLSEPNRTNAQGLSSAAWLHLPLSFPPRFLVLSCTARAHSAPVTPLAALPVAEARLRRPSVAHRRPLRSCVIRSYHCGLDNVMLKIIRLPRHGQLGETAEQNLSTF